MEFKVGDIVRAVCDTRCLSNHNIDVGSIWRVLGIDHSDGEEYDIRIIELNNTTSRYGVWANSENFEIYEIKEKKDMSTEFKIGDLVTAIDTFCMDGRDIYDNKIYKIREIGITTGNLRIILGEDLTWWVPRDKMRIVVLPPITDAKKDMDKKVKFRVGDVIVNKGKSKRDYTLIVADVDPNDPVYDILIRRTNSNGLTFTFWASSDEYVHATLADHSPKGLPSLIKIKDVIFNDPATIVFWEDGTKTIVKCQKGEKFDPEKGLAIAISKRCLGNSYCWHKRFMRWLPKTKSDNKKEKKDE